MSLYCKFSPFFSSCLSFLRVVVSDWWINLCKFDSSILQILHSTKKQEFELMILTQKKYFLTFWGNALWLLKRPKNFSLCLDTNFFKISFSRYSIFFGCISKLRQKGLKRFWIFKQTLVLEDALFCIFLPMNELSIHLLRHKVPTVVFTNFFPFVFKPNNIKKRLKTN